MTTKYQRVLAVLLVLLLGAQMCYTGLRSRPEEVELEADRPILIWYTDPDIQPYMEASAAEAASRYQVEIRTELVSEVDYIERICEASVAEEMAGPDVYVVSSALLEKAALAGLTSPVTDNGMREVWSEKAVDAVSYDGTVVARPFYIETCFLLFNDRYVNADENGSPASIEDILTYAENFEVSESTQQVENIFKWNVADVMENYMFLGAYTDLGGPNGDDKAQVSIDLDKAEECMAYYQSLNSFFAIDADTVTSEEVIREFIDGKTVFTIANVPMLAQLEKEAGSDPFYLAAALPDLTEDLKSRGLSVTNSVVVNPYSTDLEAANACAGYLTRNRADRLYEEAGKLPACTALPEEQTEIHKVVYQAYEEASEVPKIMELSNVWLHLEVVLADIWRGADVREALQQFSELLQLQLN